MTGSNYLVLFLANLNIITAGLLSFVIFLLSFREKSRLHQSSLRQWALGFFLIVWIRVPTILVSAGIITVVEKAVLFYAAAFIAFVAGFLFLYRGAAVLFDPGKFWLNVLPVILFVLVVGLVFFEYFLLGMEVFIVSGAVRLFNYSIILFFLAALFIKLWRQKSLKPSFNFVKLGIVSIAAGWLIFIAAGDFLIGGLAYYPPAFWIVPLISMPYVYLAFSVSHLFILLGFLSLGFHTDTPKPRRKKPLLVLGLASAILLGILGANLVLEEKPRATISLLPEESRFIAEEEEIPIDVVVRAEDPVNAVSAVLNFPNKKLELISFSKEGSIIDFWVQEPLVSNKEGTIEFGGIKPGGFKGEAKILTAVFKAEEKGEALVDFAEASVLAHDGKGTEVLDRKISAAIVIREKGRPSPDLSGDNSLGLSDISILIFNLGKENQPRYDLNQDGKINLTDLSILISML